MKGMPISCFVSIFLVCVLFASFLGSSEVNSTHFSIVFQSLAYTYAINAVGYTLDHFPARKHHNTVDKDSFNFGLDGYYHAIIHDIICPAQNETFLAFVEAYPYLGQPSSWCSISIKINSTICGNYLNYTYRLIPNLFQCWCVQKKNKTN